MRRILTPGEAVAIQRALNLHVNARLIEDGHFGTLSQQALMRFQAERGISPADGNPSQSTLNALGIPDLFAAPAAPTSNPLTDFFTRLVVKAAITKLKGLPAMNFLAGYATTIGGVISIVIGIAGLAGIHPAGAASLDFNASIQLIVTGWAALGLRRAIANIGK